MEIAKNQKSHSIGSARAFLSIVERLPAMHQRNYQGSLSSIRRAKAAICRSNRSEFSNNSWSTSQCAIRPRACDCSHIAQIFSVPRATFTRKFSNLAKHSRRVTRLYGCGRFWGCTSLRQKKPRGGSRGAYDTHIFPAVSPETLVSRRDYSHRFRVSTAFEPQPLTAHFYTERKGTR